MTRMQHAGRTDMWKAAIKRHSDAHRLLEAGEPHTRGAAYLAGYAIECKLKAIAMEVHGAWNLNELAKTLRIDERDVYSHRLGAWIELLPFRENLRTSAVWRDFTNQVNRWRPSWRYDGRNWALDKCTAYMASVDRFYKWLDANRC